MGQRCIAVVLSVELAKQVLLTKGKEFGSRSRNVVFDIFTGKGQDFVFSDYGDHWRKVRRVVTVPFFTNKVVQHYRRDRNQGGFDMICSGRDKIETPKQFKQAEETAKKLDLDGLGSEFGV